MGEALTFQEDSHEYRLGDVVVPSVTQIIKAVVPTDFSFIKPEVLDRKRQIGVATHKAIDLFIAGKLDEETLHEAVRPYFLSWLRWYELGAEIIQAEQRVYSPLGYAGTLDCLCEIRGEPWLFDWKCTSRPEKAHRPQTAAYALTKPEWKGRRAALYLNKNGGKPLLVEHEDSDFADWLAILRVYNYQRREAA